MRRQISVWYMQPVQEKVILNNARNKKQIIYGARSIQKHLGAMYRSTDDYDIFSSNAKKDAKDTEKELDKAIGFDYYYYKKGKNKGTHKIKSKGYDLKEGTKDDKGIVDYTQMPVKKPKHIVYNGIRYRNLSEEIAAKKRALADKNFAFRHEKDRKDLILMQSVQATKLLIR